VFAAVESGAGARAVPRALALPELRRPHAPRGPEHRPQAGPTLPTRHRRAHRRPREAAGPRTALLAKWRAAPLRSRRRPRRVDGGRGRGAGCGFVTDPRKRGSARPNANTGFDPSPEQERASRSHSPSRPSA
jgi:hypothetical protein